MMALTESGGGSDAAGAIKTFARRDGDVYRISGQKMFASIANETDVGVLFAKTDRDAGARGIAGFIVEPKKVSRLEGTADRHAGAVERISHQRSLPR
jgi:alkylation response protein AidB-like acyl-CoA dehydrogenase